MKSERGQRTLPQIGYGYRYTYGYQCCQHGKTKIVKCFLLVKKDGLGFEPNQYLYHLTKY